MHSPAFVPAAAQAERSDAQDVVELEPTDANALSMLDWSYDNFPPAPAMADAGSPSHDASPTMMRPAPVFRDDPTERAAALADEDPTNVQQALEDGDPTNVQPSLVEGDVLASLTYEAPEQEPGIVVEEGIADEDSVEIEIDAVALEQELGQELEPATGAANRISRSKTCSAEEESETVRSPALSPQPPTVAVAPPPPLRPRRRRPQPRLRRSRKKMTAPTSMPKSQRSSAKKPPSCSRPPITRCHPGSRIAATPRWSSS